VSGSANPDTTHLEAALREHTGIFERACGVLAIAPERSLDDALAAVPHLAYDRSGLADVERLHYTAESFDAVIGDADALAHATHRPLRDLARLLRPGGRLVLRVTSGRAQQCVTDLAASGFLVVPAHVDEREHIVIGVRGEHAPRSH
jgi:SAM-dependent methyltransferase